MSENYNSFGLRGHVMMARDGEAWKAAASDFHRKKQGKVLTVFCMDDCPQWYQLGFEIPERLENAPPNVVAEVWEDDDDENRV